MKRDGANMVRDRGGHRLGYPVHSGVEERSFSRSWIQGALTGPEFVKDFTGTHSVISYLGEPHHAHRHLAGWSWPGDFVTLAALHAWSEKISALTTRSTRYCHSQSGHLVRSQEGSERQDKVQGISFFRCGNEAGMSSV
jgi:hypothetical protein